MPNKTTAALRTLLTSVASASMSDRDLLQRFAREGDQAAFATLVRRHGSMVLSVCQRELRYTPDAEDASQATFLLLARKAKGGRWELSLANWLYTTARKVAANARVAARRRARREARAAVREAVEPVDVTAREFFAALDEELEKLPPLYREPLVLCHLEGLTRDEAAHRLGVPLGTVKIRLERGRKRLQDSLTTRGLGLGAGLLAIAVISPAGASSPQLVESIMAAALGRAPAAVAALAKGASMNALFSKLLIAAVSVAALGLGSLSLTVGGQPDRAVAPEMESQKPPDIPKELEKGGGLRGDAAVAAEMKTLEGTWLVTGAEVWGRKATKKELADGKMVFVGIDPADPASTVKVILEPSIVHEVVFKGDKVVMKAGGRRPELKFVLYPDKTPKAIDIHYTATTSTKLAGGPGKEGTVELIRLGIYKVEGDRLTICLTDGGDTNPPIPRPNEFDTSGTERLELYTFHRLPAK
jgi:RNA polymerase sigma factor (sigma-70 family)